MDYALTDRYLREEGTVYLTGVQALVRVLFDRARQDRARGLRTGTFVSGYEGSPLGGYDQEIVRRAGLPGELDVVHQPGVNEELAATSVARLALDPAFGQQVTAPFGAGSTVSYRLHPPVLRALGLRHKIRSAPGSAEPSAACTRCAGCAGRLRTCSATAACAGWNGS
jgi:hypothetical protein